jgi:hypothetical protein
MAVQVAQVERIDWSRNAAALTNGELHLWSQVMGCTCAETSAMGMPHAVKWMHACSTQLERFCATWSTDINFMIKSRGFKVLIWDNDSSPSSLSLLVFSTQLTGGKAS